MKILNICFLVLSVSLLCVLVTTAPTAESDVSSPPKTVATKNSTAIKNSTSTTKNETSVAMPTNATTTNTTTNGSTSLPHDTKETTPTSQAEKATDDSVSSSSAKREEKPKPKSAKFLLYELEKDIRNLSLDNVNYILDMGDDVLAYSLLDKLGYRKGDIENDPHLKVIEDNKDKLFEKLEARRKELTPVTKPPLPPTVPPPRVTTTHVIDVAKIKYDIVSKIPDLSLDEINTLLEYGDDMLPYALGIELGYDEERDVEHFMYLDDLGGKELREILLTEKEKKSNMAPPPPPKANPEPPKDSSSNEPIVPNGGKNLLDENKGGGDPDGENSADKPDEGQGNHSEGDNDPKPDQQDGPSSKSDNQSDGTAPAGDHNDSNQGPPDDENEDDVNTNDKEPDNKGQTGTGKDPQRGNPDDNHDDDDARPGEDGDNRNMEFTNDDDDIKLDLNKEEENQDKPKAGSEVESGADDEYDEYMDEKSSGGFGAWHFLIIFIVIGVAVVIGYLCVHNRKKLREGVESYVSDASKRRRRAREYKPLATT